LVWGRYLAVAGAYAACYELTRYFSFSHWMLPAGLRLACLLLVPRRFWPALAVGEALPVAEMAFLHTSVFGLAWAIAASIPPIVFCMPVVAWMRNRAPLMLGDGQINMSLIASVTLLCAAVTSAENSAVLTTMVMSDGSPGPAMTVPIFLVWFLGAYLGALALVPTILGLRERLAAQPHGVLTWHAVTHSALFRDTVLIALPSLLLLTVLTSFTSDGALQCARIAMGLPVIVMALRHGWHGASVSSLLASIAIASTAFKLQDPAMIQAQAILAFIITTSLLFGVRIARRQAAVHVLAHEGLSAHGRRR
jgi:glucose-6-phosphate-specific signal transduction histidine kinase